MHKINNSFLSAGTTSRGVAPSAFEVTRLVVPRYTIMGSDAKLICEYENKSLDIYSIKWYKNDREFFHHISSLDPPKRNFSLPGINVDVSFYSNLSLYVVITFNPSL